MSTPTNQEKGDRLERAVRAIEQLILQSHPMYSDRTFRFWSKRIMDVGGTHFGRR